MLSKIRSFANSAHWKTIEIDQSVLQMQRCRLSWSSAEEENKRTEFEQKILRLETHVFTGRQNYFYLHLSNNIRDMSVIISGRRRSDCPTFQTNLIFCLNWPIQLSISRSDFCIRQLYSPFMKNWFFNQLILLGFKLGFLY